MNQAVPYYSSFVDSVESVQASVEKCADYFPFITFFYSLEDGRVTYFNNKFADVLGYQVNEMERICKNLSSIVYPEDFLALEEAINEYSNLADRESHTVKVRLLHRDGSCRYFRLTGIIAERRNGFPVSVLCTAENITELSRLEDEFSGVRQLFDETERLLLFGTWSWTASADKLQWTDGMYHLLGYEPEELQEVTNEFYRSHVLPEHLDELERVIYESIRNSRGFELEYVVRTKTGEEKYVFTKGKALLDKDGNLKKIIGITRDITNKKNFEKERERSIRELNRSNKELEEFAYVASHDMHEPLRKILTFCERMNGRFSSALGDDGKLYLDRISSSASNMRNLIDNLLEFSKISRGKRSFVLSDLNEVLREVVSDQELRIEETGTEVRFKDLPRLELVPSEIRQLFNNLVGNALKFRKPGVQPVITITSRKLNHKEKQDHLLPFNQVFYQINVQDNGIGFEDVYAERIFEIFQRLHGKTEYSGSGIGLAICKKIVENHDGLIYATGQPGVGSVFSVILPEKQN